MRAPFLERLCCVRGVERARLIFPAADITPRRGYVTGCRLSARIPIIQIMGVVEHFKKEGRDLDRMKPIFEELPPETDSKVAYDMIK